MSYIGRTGITMPDTDVTAEDVTARRVGGLFLSIIFVRGFLLGGVVFYPWGAVKVFYCVDTRTRGAGLVWCHARGCNFTISSSSSQARGDVLVLA